MRQLAAEHGHRQMTARPSSRLLAVPLAQLKSTHSTLTSSACFSRDLVRVRVSPDSVRMGSTAPEATAAATVSSEEAVVQYVVLRRDLIDAWPLGSVVTQGCHASVAAVWSHKDDPHTVEYCSPGNIDFMHKVKASTVRSNSILVFFFPRLRSANVLIFKYLF